MSLIIYSLFHFYRIEYRSPFRERLEHRTIPGVMIKDYKQMKYPIFLQHTLFHADDDKVHRIRKMFDA